MKNIIIVISCLAILMSSCKTSNSVVSNGLFQKRKYNKGYHKNSKGIAKAKRENNSVQNYNYTKEVVKAEKQSVLTPEIWQKWKMTQPHTHFIKFRDAGHLVPMEYPAELSDMLRRALNSNS